MLGYHAWFSTGSMGKILGIETNHASLQGVSKIHGITSGISSSYLDNKNSLYECRSGNVYFPSF
jgi:hypothetical protein